MGLFASCFRLCLWFVCLMTDFWLNYELFVFLSKRLQLVTIFFIFAIVFIKIGGFYEEVDDFVIDGRSVGYDNEHCLHERVLLVAAPKNPQPFDPNL